MEVALGNRMGARSVSAEGLGVPGHVGAETVSQTGRRPGTGCWEPVLGPEEGPAGRWAHLSPVGEAMGEASPKGEVADPEGIL